jgi:hypothetical protein
LAEIRRFSILACTAEMSFGNASGHSRQAIARQHIHHPYRWQSNARGLGTMLFDMVQQI